MRKSIPLAASALALVTGLGLGSSPASAATATTPHCTNSALTARLVNLQGTAGSTVGDLRLTNVSTATCWTRGYPGVSYVGYGNGTQIGRSAAWQPGTITTITLAPGQYAQSPIQMVDVYNYPASTCRPTKVDGLRVYVPGSTLAKFIPYKTTGCLSTAITTITVKPLEH